MTTWNDDPVSAGRYDGPERRQASREPLFTQILATLFLHREPVPLGPGNREPEAG